MSLAQAVKGIVLAAAVLASASALGADANSPPAPAAPAGMPSAAAVVAAGEILNDIGIEQTIAVIVPTMLAELERNVTNTRPEIKDSLRETLKSIQPEFDKSAQDMFNQAATLLASQMSEKEAIDIAAFFASPTGKKYLAVEPVFFQRFSALADPWRQQMSTAIVERARAEMKKKGLDF